MEFEALCQRARKIRAQYAELETQRYGRAWTREEIALGFMGDVGDLMKLLIAQNGVQPYPMPTPNSRTNWRIVCGP